jgi:hypothetical protein
LLFYIEENYFFGSYLHPKITVPTSLLHFLALRSENEDLIEGAAILLGSAAQSNAQVQDSAEKAGLLKTLLDLFETW